MSRLDFGISWAVKTIDPKMSHVIQESDAPSWLGCLGALSPPMVSNIKHQLNLNYKSAQHWRQRSSRYIITSLFFLGASVWPCESHVVISTSGGLVLGGSCMSHCSDSDHWSNDTGIHFLIQEWWHIDSFGTCATWPISHDRHHSNHMWQEQSGPLLPPSWGVFIGQLFSLHEAQYPEKCIYTLCQHAVLMQLRCMFFLCDWGKKNGGAV